MTSLLNYKVTEQRCFGKLSFKTLQKVAVNVSAFHVNCCLVQRSEIQEYQERQLFQFLYFAMLLSSAIYTV